MRKWIGECGGHVINLLMTSSTDAKLVLLLLLLLMVSEMMSSAQTVMVVVMRWRRWRRRVQCGSRRCSRRRYHVHSTVAIKWIGIRIKGWSVVHSISAVFCRTSTRNSAKIKICLETEGSIVWRHCLKNKLERREEEGLKEAIKKERWVETDRSGFTQYSAEGEELALYTHSQLPKEKETRAVCLTKGNFFKRRVRRRSQEEEEEAFHHRRSMKADYYQDNNNIVIVV